MASEAHGLHANGDEKAVSTRGSSSFRGLGEGLLVRQEGGPFIETVTLPWVGLIDGIAGFSADSSDLNIVFLGVTSGFLLGFGSANANGALEAASGEFSGEQGPNVNTEFLDRTSGAGVGWLRLGGEG